MRGLQCVLVALLVCLWNIAPAGAEQSHSHRQGTQQHKTHQHRYHDHHHKRLHRHHRASEPTTNGTRDGEGRSDRSPPVERRAEPCTTPLPECGCDCPITD